MEIGELNKYSHRRKNILNDSWVLVSPHRLARPWDGKHEKTTPENRPGHDPQCYLCPGNERANGVQTPAYQDTYVFDNDFSALMSDAPKMILGEDDLLVASAEAGICRVICFSPRHDLSIAEMPVEKIVRVVELWSEQYRELSALPDINSVMIFENRGEVIGCSNQHPHGQIWGTASIPDGLAREIGSFAKYRQEKQACLLCDYLKLELARGERVVCENEHFVTLVPFWACWPYETLIVAREHHGQLNEFSEATRAGFADIIKQTTVRYDNLFQVSFPYAMGMHQSGAPDFHFHAHYFPPLLRSATVRKFMIGFEMLGEPQRDFTPEQGAAILRDLPGIHFKDAKK
jgi:UDPglucose--hexose-1-phosphate uridylyltransferase